jgi:glycosidase
MDDPESYLSLYSMLLHLRRIDRVLIDGSFEVIDIVDDMLVYERAGDDRVYFVVMNFSEQPRSVQVPYGDVLFLTNRDDIELYTDDGELRLKGLSAVLIKMVA